jgi:ATP-dependent Clp protease ATP-binding subunit ClpA
MVNPLVVLAGVAIAGAAMAFGATFSHALRHPVRQVKSARAESEAFALMARTDFGEIGRQMSNWRLLASEEVDAQAKMPDSVEDLRERALSSTKTVLDEATSGLELLYVAEIDAYWATSQYRRIRQEFQKSVSELSEELGKTLRSHRTAAGNVGSALKSLSASLGELSDFAVRNRLIHH